MAIPKVAADIMTQNVVTLVGGQSIGLPAELMKICRFRHMPVAEDERLLGLVTERDILGASASTLLPASKQQSEYLARKFLVRDIMKRDVQTVRPDTPIEQVVELMQKNKFGCLPVVKEENTLVGIITEADFVKLSAALLKELSSAS